ncbi:MAG: helix-turn-helix transcriptional regulator [Deltaproteobacteria bacterium]|jgi:DNA-binding XRE family transcriptional regulator|nr:helix-turn-helix transcriptional regulator [Deltaproteobacteria bacterium]
MTTLKLSRLAEIREQRLMSRAELARKAEISPLTILKIENGQRCRPETARKIIMGLGYNLEDNERLYKEIIGPNAYDPDTEEEIALREARLQSLKDKNAEKKS